MDRRLCNAARNGNLPEVQGAIRNGADCNQLVLADDSDDYDDGLRESALHVACQNRHLHVVRALLDAGTEVDIKDTLGRTPLLHDACSAYADNDDGRNRHLEVVQELVQRGANICMKNRGGTTPYDMARGKFETINYLQERYAELVAEREGNDCVHWILQMTQWIVVRNVVMATRLDLSSYLRAESFIEILRHLISRDVTVLQDRDGTGKMPLHVAATSVALP